MREHNAIQLLQTVCMCVTMNIHAQAYLGIRRKESCLAGTSLLGFVRETHTNAQSLFKWS